MVIYETEEPVYTRYKGIDSLDEYIGRFLKLGTGFTDIASVTELIGNCYTDIQVLKEKDRMEEFMFLGLRCISGISRLDFYNRFIDRIEKMMKLPETNMISFAGP